MEEILLLDDWVKVDDWLAMRVQVLSGSGKSSKGVLRIKEPGVESADQRLYHD